MRWLSVVDMQSHRAKISGCNASSPKTYIRKMMQISKCVMAGQNDIGFNVSLAWFVV